MRCMVLKCMSNEDGYCPLDSYIPIEEKEEESCPSNFQNAEMTFLHGQWYPTMKVLL